MAGGINNLARQLGKLKELFKDRISTEQVESVVKSAGAIASSSASLSSSAETIVALIENCEAFPSDFTTDLARLLKSSSGISQKVLDEKLVEGISKAIENVNSLSELIKLNSGLVKLMAVSAAVSSAVTILTPVFIVAAAYAKSKAMKEFQDALDKHLTLINIELMQQTRIQSGLYLLKYNKHMQNGIEFGDDKSRIETLASEARNNIDFIPTVDRALLSTYAEKLIDALYAKIANPLDTVSTELSHDFISAVVLHSEHTIDKFPVFNPTGLNYALVKSQYGSKRVEETMNTISTHMYKEGGYSLYYYTNEQEGPLLNTFCRYCIAASTRDMTELNDVEQANIDRLVNTIREIDPVIRDTFRDKAISSRGDQADLVLPDNVVRVIANRAYIEFCKNNARYYQSFISRFVIDTVEGITDAMFRDGPHPVDALTKAFSELSVEGPIQPTARRLWNRPMRTLIYGSPVGWCYSVMGAGCEIVYKAGQGLDYVLGVEPSSRRPR